MVGWLLEPADSEVKERGLLFSIVQGLEEKQKKRCFAVFSQSGEERKDNAVRRVA